MIPETVLGMTLDRALALLREMGIEPTVRQTRAPLRRNAPAGEAEAREAGTLRVIRVRGDEMTVSPFLDGTPDLSALETTASV